MKKFVAFGLTMALLGLPGVVSAEEPASVAECAAPTLVGTAGDDVLTGTEGDDVISGLGGNDIIDGLGGNDEICGGAGGDTINGGDGADAISGGPGNDMILGGAGNDVIHGDNGRDSLGGQSGRDRLNGGDGNDVLRGNGGIDRLWGDGGDDVLRGKAGDDILRGGPGFDVLWGGLGADHLIGGPHGDLLLGRGGADVLLGHGGAETIRAGLGDDFLDGGTGPELLDAGSGSDTCADEGDLIACPEELGNAYGGEVIVADDQEPPTLNPLMPGGDNFIVWLIGQAHLAGVFDVDGNTLELTPELVTELPTVANGGLVINADGTMTVRYQIREEAVWSDGVPISGDDFAFTLATILKPNLPTDKSTYRDIVSSTPGPKTFEYVLNEPTVLHENLFRFLIPKHAVEGTNFATRWNDRMWPAAGPFVFDEWVKGGHVTLVRNDNYWKSDADTGQPLPFLDAVEFKFIPTQNSIVQAFEQRRVDVVEPPPATDTIERLQVLEREGAIVEVVGGPVWEHINFQFGPGRLTRNPDSINDNLNYRKGVMHTIDRQLLVDEIVGGHVDPMSSWVDAFTPSLSNSAWDQYDYNPTTAMAYFDAAKQELGINEISAVFSTTANNDARVRMAELFVDMFAAVGVVYENQLEDSQIFFGETLDFGYWDVGEWAWSAAPGLAFVVEVLDYWDPEAPPPGGANYYRWGSADSSVIDASTARFAALRDEARATVDDAEITALIDEAQTILADNAVILPLYQRVVVAAAWGDELGGFKHNTSRSGHTWNIEAWHRVDR